MKNVTLVTLFVLSVISCKKDSPHQSLAVSLYPNPCDSFLIMEVSPSGEEYQAQLKSLVGNAIVSIHTNQAKYKMNTDTLKEGVYVLIIRQEDTISKKVVILH